MIAPFLLLPFIENAFKHVGHAGESFLRITVTLTGCNLELEVTNSRPNTPTVHVNTLPNSGIGLINVRRRLELLYPGKHQLRINETGDEFRVSLQLELAGVILPVSKMMATA